MSLVDGWIAEARGVRLQLQLTEHASSEVVFFELSGNGSLTTPATSETQLLSPSGFLITPGSVLINFFAAEMNGNTYGQFNGRADGVTLTGMIRNDGAAQLGRSARNRLPSSSRAPERSRR